VNAGTVQAATVVRRSLTPALLGEAPPRIALVVSDAGPHLIARATGDMRPGDRVSLTLDRGAPVATPTGRVS
jgi:uncharacterized OB-fold protein